MGATTICCDQFMTAYSTMKEMDVNRKSKLEIQHEVHLYTVCFHCTLRCPFCGGKVLLKRIDTIA